MTQKNNSNTHTNMYKYIHSPHPTRMLTHSMLASSCHDPGKSARHQILQKEAIGIIGEVWPTGCQLLLLLPATREERMGRRSYGLGSQVPNGPENSAMVFPFSFGPFLVYSSPNCSSPSPNVILLQIVLIQSLPIGTNGKHL
jgi:hypothetical protein